MDWMEAERRQKVWEWGVDEGEGGWVKRIVKVAVVAEEVEEATAGVRKEGERNQCYEM